MKYLVVDDELPSIRNLETAIAEADPAAKIYCFQESENALEFAKTHKIDAAFLDIEMPDQNGLQLAKKLKDIRNTINIVFVTGYSSYAYTAFCMHASGYVLKPATGAIIKKELKNLRYPTAKPDNGLRVQCFGYFEVFYNGKPLMFQRSKSKEIFAYLVDRNGAAVTKKDIATILWPDDEYTRNKQIQLQTLLTDMLNTFNGIGCKSTIIRKKATYAVNTATITCDYYDYMRGNTEAINKYMGEYMFNYSWAEFTSAALQ